MKHILAKTLSALLAAAMLLTGCASDDSSSEKGSSAADSSTSSTADSSLASDPDASDDDTSSEDDTSKDESSSSAPADSSATDKDSSQSGKDEKKTSSITPLMWEVTSPSGSKITFLGSMHALKEDAYPLPEVIENAYKNADILAVECDVTEAASDLGAQLDQLDKMFYTDGTGIADHIKPEIYKGIMAFADKCDSDLSLYSLCKPWVFLSLLENMAVNNTDLDASIGFDMYMLNKAHEEKKEILELESVKFQTDMIMNMSDEICESLLAGYTAETYDSILKNLEDTYTAWCKGDKKFFEDSVDIDANVKAAADAGLPMSEKEIALLKEYNKVMIDDRNVGMADKAAELIEGGKNVFYVVGAAHFAGEKGIIKLLEKKGYTVKQIMP